ncbi:TPA: hypothetical protein ACN36F_002100 [Vibrio parahaemolyticus]
MKDSYEILDEFNKTFSANASLCVDTRIGLDVDGCSEFFMYQRLEDQRKASLGEVLYRRIGSYCVGDYFNEQGTAGFKLSTIDYSVERFFPLSSNEVCSKLDIGYKSKRLGGRRDFSTDNYKRWWVDSFDTLSKDFPEQANKVEVFLYREIQSLADTARSKGLKSGWVYYRFQDRCEHLSKRVNLDFLIPTTYFFDPVLFYNQFSPKIVSINDQERRELDEKIQADFLYG